jgi:hypothetical protein
MSSDLKWAGLGFVVVSLFVLYFNRAAIESSAKGLVFDAAKDLQVWTNHTLEGMRNSSTVALIEKQAASQIVEILEDSLLPGGHEHVSGLEKKAAEFAEKELELLLDRGLMRGTQLIEDKMTEITGIIEDRLKPEEAIAEDRPMTGMIPFEIEQEEECFRYVDSIRRGIMLCCYSAVEATAHRKLPTCFRLST